MLSALTLAALLSVSDPLGDAALNLAAPSATLMRQQGAFDIREVHVFGQPVSGQPASARPASGQDALTLAVTLESLGSFPEAIVEIYLSDPEVTGSAALLPGSGMALPAQMTWHYAFRIVGERHVSVFRGHQGTYEDITEASGATLTRSANTLTLRTRLDVPERFSLYGLAGAFDPFSPHGWRSLRRDVSPWHFSGRAGTPALDVIADNPDAQRLALERGVLPQIRASSSEPGWLALAGLGVMVTLGSLGVRYRLGRYDRDAAPQPTPPGPLSPLHKRDYLLRRTLLQRAPSALASGQATLTLVSGPPNAPPPQIELGEPELSRV